jgi:membrane-associated HD superfamily phosphohydrolase
MIKNMRDLLKFVFKFTLWVTWFTTTIIGLNLINQKVDWQNYLGVFILCLSLLCVVYYVKNNFHTLLNVVKNNLSKMVLYLKKMFKK